jgi:hypothetical protein
MLARMRRAAAATTLVFALTLSAASVLNQSTRKSADFATRYSAGVATARGLDPYDPRQLLPIEHRLVGPGYDYPFHDPPPVAWGFRALSAISFDAASLLWRVVLLVCAFACAVLACRLTGIRVRGLVGWGLVVALALDFAPLRDGISVLQIDPFVGALALVALVTARRGGGLLQAVATMKPQAALLASAGGLAAGRLRFAGALVAGWAVLGLATVLAGGPTWENWLDAVRHASRARGAGMLVGAALLTIVALALAVRAARGVRFQPLSAPLGIAAAVNGTLAPLVFLNPQSDVLMLVPLLLLATLVRGRGPEAAALGLAAGIFTTSGLFAVSYHSGVSHALVPIAIAALLAAAAWERFPSHRLTVVVALAVNAAVTLPPLPPRAYDWLGVAASLVTLALLARVLPRRPV